MAYKNYSNGYGRKSAYSSRYQYTRQPRKHSGAKFVRVEEGVFVVSAWRVNRKGEMLVLYARPYKGTSEHNGKRGAFLNYFVTITNKNNYNVVRTSGLLYPDDKRLLLPDFGEIVTNNGAGGTWCSAIKRRR